MKEIHDLALASYLSTIGYKLISVKSRDGRKFAFSFEESATLEADILSFYNRTAKVDPLSFAEVMRNLKALVLQG